MPVHIKIEEDGLYLMGIEKGLERGIERGIEKGRALEKELAQQKIRQMIRQMIILGIDATTISNSCQLPLPLILQYKAELQEEEKSNFVD